MEISKTLNNLKALGFTEYEAKIYLALLRCYPSNGNAIATLSGVPTPKVYETLRKMQERQIVFIVSGGGDKRNSLRYSPLPYQDLLDNKKKIFSDNVEFLSEALSEISSMSDTDWTELFVIHGYLSAMESVQSAIMDCKSEIIMSCWCNEFETLKELLNEVHNRGVSVVTLTFDEGDIDVPWRHFKHYDGKTTQYRHAGELSIVIDQSKAIVLQSLNSSPHAVVSSHQITISTIRNYIRHDIYVNRILHDFEEVIKERYGPELENLIHDF